MSDHYLLLRDTTGTLKYILRPSAASDVDSNEAGFLSLSCSQKINDMAQMTFIVDTDSDVGTDIATNGHRWIVEFWRKDQDYSVDWTQEFVGFILGRKYTDDNDAATMEVKCYSAEWYLKSRYVLWHPGVSNRTEFASAKGETIMKTIVDYNCCSNATVVNGRWRAGTITGFSIVADAASGNTISWECHSKNVLETLRELATVAGGDFSVSQDTTKNYFKFNWHTGQRGSDKSATKVFDVKRGNVTNMVYDNDRSEEKTVCAVLGPQTSDTTRDYTIRTGTDYVLTTNDVESIVDGQGDTDATTRNSTGDSFLSENEQKKAFSFDAVQTEGMVYRRDIVLGDLVGARYKAFVSLTLKISGVQLDVSGDKEQIKYEFASY